MASSSKRDLTVSDVINMLDYDDTEHDFSVDYPVDDLTSASESEDEIECQSDLSNIPHPVFSSSDEDEDQDRGGDARPPPQKRKRNGKHVDPLSNGWSKTFSSVDTSFLGDETAGPKNIPDHVNSESEPSDFVDLFLDEKFWNMLVTFTNLRAAQTKIDKPNNYYAKKFKNDVTVAEMKAFIGLRIQMEHSVVKRRIEEYWHGSGKNFVGYTPGFREVMERDRFLSLWTFLHLLDEQNPEVDKSDKIYKVRPVLDIMLQRFREYYNADQHLSLDEGMIPTKNRLAIKQYIKDKPIKWGIKSFLLCDSNSGYILNAEIYTGKNRKPDFVDDLGATGNVVRDLIRGANIERLNHIIVMDRFYSSVKLFDHLYSEMGTFALGTIMTNRSCYPTELKRTNKSFTARGQFDYKCRENLTGLVWMDRKPINFLSSSHDPSNVGTCDRKNKDGTVVKVTCPQIVIDYNKYMGGCDKNDQITRLNKTRRHYRWPRRLFVKILHWVFYNSYVIMDKYSPHSLPGRRFRTFGMFLDKLCLQLIGDYRTLAVRRDSRELELPQRMLNVGLHYPERPGSATGNNICVVCAFNLNKWIRDNPNQSTKDCPYKKHKTTFWCGYCHRYLCIRQGSKCWNDYHNKVEYWR